MRATRYGMWVALVGVLALILWAAREPEETPPLPVPPTGGESDAPEVCEANVGKRVELSGRVILVETNTGHDSFPVLVVSLGRREAVCEFPRPGFWRSSPVARLREGDAVTVRGTLDEIIEGRAYLSGCEAVGGLAP